MLLLYFTITCRQQTSIFIRSEIWLNFTKIPTNLAQNMISKICANLLNFIKNILYSPSFVEKHRKDRQDFTRSRKLPFHLLVLYLLNLPRSSYQAELNKFFKILSGTTVAKTIISKVALCKARKKLKYEAFTELNKETIDYFYTNLNPRTWHGFYLKAIDGSTVKLPNSPELRNHFGTWNPRQGAPVPMARISQMFDPLNRITCHAIISPKGIGERELAAQHCQHLASTDLVLLDRGYPAFWLFKLIRSYNAHFCSRISNKKWKIVQQFVASGKKEQVVTLQPPVTSIEDCQNRNLGTDPMSLRLIRVELKSGEIEVLITSLTDCVKFPVDLFADLYHDRWPVEEDYKVIKCRMELENFSGKSELSVYQDFHAQIFTKNVTSMLVAVAQHRVDMASKKTIYDYRVNFTMALSTIRDTLVSLFQRSNSVIEPIVSDILESIATVTEPERPWRKFPRNHKRAQRKYCLSYKPIL